MYYIANFSVLSLEKEQPISEKNKLSNACAMPEANNKEMRELVFCQADLWNVHRQMRTTHVTDRLPRTWEGLC